MQDHENDPLTPDEPIIFEPVSEPLDETSLQEDKIESVPDSSEPIESVDEEELPKEESRARKGFRKFIRWTFGLLIVFGMGFLTAVFTIYNLKVDELDQSQNSLESAGATVVKLEAEISAQQDEIDNLDAQISTLNIKITNLETNNQNLADKENDFILHIALLKARADVINAQVALYEENPAQARVLLESAGQTLTTIETLLPDDLKDVVAPLQNRLELALGELNDDPETAIADLSILASDLLEIENALFSE